MEFANEQDQADIRNALAEMLAPKLPEPKNSVEAGLVAQHAANPLPEGERAFTKEEWDARQKEADKFQSPLGKAASVLTGAASGLSLGISNPILNKFGVPVQKLEEYNPTETSIGEIGGNIAPFIATGGTSALAKGVAKLGAPVLGASKVGAVAKGLVEAGLETESKNVARQILGKAAATGIGGATEGAIYGTGQLISDVGMGDPELNAEKILSTIGGTALFGGSVGAGLRGMSEVGPSLFEKTKGLSKSLTEDIAHFTQETLAPKLGKVSEVLTNQPEGSLQKIFKEAVTPEGAKIIAEPKLATEARQRKFVHDVTDYIQSSDHIENGIWDNRKVENEALLSALPEEAHAAASDSARYEIAVAKKEVEKMLANETRYGNRSALDQTKEYLETLEKRAAKVTNAADAHALVSEGKSFLDKKIDYSVGPKDTAMLASDQGLRSVRLDFKNHLENPALYQEAGIRQGAFNEAMKDAITKKKRFLRVFGDPVPTSRGGTEMRANSRKISILLRDPDAPKNVDRFRTLKEYIDSRSSLFDQLESLPEGIVDSGFQAESKEAFNQLEGLLRKNLDASQLQDDIKKLGGTLSDILKTGDVVKGALAYGVGGPLGAAGYGLLQVLKHPQNLANALAHLTIKVEKMSKAVDGSIGKFINSSKAADVIRKSAVPVAIQLEKGEKRDEKLSDKDYEKTFRHLNEVVTEPQKAIERMTAPKEMQQFAKAAPNISQHLTTKAMNAAQYLYQTAPKNPNPVMMFNRPYRPSDAELAKWSRRVEAVNNPLGVLKDMAKGTLTPEKVDAIKATAPKLYAEIQQKLLDRVTELREELPYQKRLQLSFLFQVPVDSVMRPEFVRQMQASFSQPENLPGAGVGGQNLNMASASMSQSQKIEAR